MKMASEAMGLFGNNQKRKTIGGITRQLKAEFYSLLKRMLVMRFVR